MQNGFCNPLGFLGQIGVDISPCNAVIGKIKEIAQFAHQHEIPVIYTKQEHLPEDSVYVRNRLLLSALPNSHAYSRAVGKLPCVKGTWDAEIVDELRLEPVDYLVRKHRFNAFYNTDLEIILRTLNVQIVIVVGVTTNVCVDSTVREAYFRDYEVLVIKDAVAAPGEQLNLHQATLETLSRYFAWTISSSELFELIQSVRQERRIA